MPRPKRIILIGCVKQKRSGRHPARSLYTSDLFAKRRSYAAGSGRPWFILSARYGLIHPNTPIESYDEAMGEKSAAIRRTWGSSVAEALAQRFGSLKSATIEIHAGADYRAALEEHLFTRGAGIEPTGLEGLAIGEQKRWYLHQLPGSGPDRSLETPRCSRAEFQHALDSLDRAPTRIAASAWPGRLTGLDSPGLYSWWVDWKGARHLSEGSGHRISAGRIYAGQTGATKWPSGRMGKATLATRIGQNHLRGTISGSTFRRTLAAALSEPLNLRADDGRVLQPPGEGRLDAWMLEHLAVAVHRYLARDYLADLEGRLLKALDPPLNLYGVPPTALRLWLTKVR